MTPLQTIRDFLREPIPHCPQDMREYSIARNKAIEALSTLEEQKPVAFVNGVALSMLENGESIPAYNCWGSPWAMPLYANPVAK